MLPACQTDGNEPFCTVFRTGMSDSRDGSRQQSIGHPEGLSVATATGRLMAAPVRLDNGSAQRACATTSEDETRGDCDVPETRQ
jgi:hypothetical protein